VLVYLISTLSEEHGRIGCIVHKSLIVEVIILYLATYDFMVWYQSFTGNGSVFLKMEAAYFFEVFAIIFICHWSHLA
jgi:hypothetical protein